MGELILNKRIKTDIHGAKKERREGKIPGVIYGKEIGNELFHVDARVLSKQLSVTGEHGVLTFNLDGKTGTAIIKEVQKSPVEHRVIHIDLEEIAANAMMQTEISIRVIGKAMLESKGLILQTQRDLVKVSCKANNLPKDVELDVSKGTAGTVYTFKDLILPEDVEVVDDLSTAISSISEEAEEDVAEVVAPAAVVAEETK